MPKHEAPQEYKARRASPDAPTRSLLKRRQKYPLSSFGPEWRQLLTRTAVSEVLLEFKTAADAIRFQMRLHLFRSRLRDENDSFAELAYRSRTSRLRDYKPPYRLKIYPVEAPFTETFAQVGIGFSDPTLAQDPGTPVTLDVDPLAAMLKEAHEEGAPLPRPSRRGAYDLD